MTNSNGNRLDRIENLVEANARAIAEIRELTLTNARAITNQQDQINVVALAAERTANAVAELLQKVETVVERMDRQIMVIARQQDAMEAELDRQGRILDYLMRRDRDGNGDEPQI